MSTFSGNREHLLEHCSEGVTPPVNTSEGSGPLPLRSFYGGVAPPPLDPWCSAPWCRTYGKAWGSLGP